MADNTIIQQGNFTSTGGNYTVQLRSDLDWMRVYNLTQSAGSTSGRAVEFFWMRGMPAGYGLKYYRGGSDKSVFSDYVSTGGFSLIDSSVQTPGALNSTVSAISTATPPVVTASSTAGLAAGSIVRFVNVLGAQQFGGIDFEIDTVNANTNFRLPFAPTIGAGTSGSFRPIPFDPIYYPRRRYITAITAANPAVVTMSVSHGYTVGQKVRFTVPAAYGMIEMDGRTATVTGINTTTNTITTDIDASAFTSFSFPLTTAVPFSPALVVPVGEAASSTYANLLDDATINTSYIGMVLYGGAAAAAGSASDVIYWTAGKSFNM